jgi:hypothetical protein
MYYLIIDTCVWIELGSKYTEVRKNISDLVKQEKVRLIVPQIVVDEWDKHKHPKIVEAKKSSFRGGLGSAKGLLEALEEDEADNFRKLLDRIQEQQDRIESQALEEISAIECLFKHPSTIRLSITDNVKLQAVDYALAKKPPFGDRNSIADALIMLSAVDYISQENLTDCIFVSSDRAFSSPSKDGQIHEDLRELFEEYEIRYFINIGKAINEIQGELVGIEIISEIERERIITDYLSVFQEAMRPTIGLSAFLEAIRPATGLSDIGLSAFQEAMRPATGLSDIGLSAFLEAIRPATGLSDIGLLAFQEAMRPATGLSDIDLSAFEEAMRAAAGLSDIDLSAFEEAMRAAAGLSDIDLSAFEEAMRAATDLSALDADNVKEGFVVYVNYTTHAATIHSITCRYYKNRVADKTDNGHWEGPFTCFEDAQTYASGEDKRKARTCKVCLIDHPS